MPSALTVAIVGSGPSGFYAAEALMEALPEVEVSMLERLPVPFGLVRSGVAPDHPKLKQVSLVYDRIARSGRLHFIGNVRVGADVTVRELRETHHGVIFAYGAEGDRALGIPGEQLRGSHAARDFVGWYNGHQDHGDLVFDLSQGAAAIIGQGNVALDVARILAKPADELRRTDISAAALKVLAESRVRDIHLFGRRGPADTKFSPRELAEFVDILGCDPVVAPADLSDVPASADGDTRRKLDLFRQFAAGQHRIGRRRCHFHFHHVPLAVLGSERVTGIRFRTDRPGEKPAIVDMPCGVLFRAIGYRGRQMPGLPFDERAGSLRHCAGRLIAEDGTPVHGLYAAGWIKRGATGVIGTNRADSLETVETLLSDVPLICTAPKPGAAGLRALLAARGIRTVDYQDWLQIDRREVALGSAKGKPREKFTSLAALLAAVG